MDNSQTTSRTIFGLREVLEDEWAAARDQLHAAWQIHTDRVAEQLAAGWEGQIQKVVEERFSELERRVRAGFDEELAFRLDQERIELRRELGRHFNQTARRLRQCATADELHAALLDSALGVCERAVLFSFSGQFLKVVGARGFREEAAAALLKAEVPLSSAPAVANAVDSMDAVIAMRSAGELSDRLAWLLGEAHDRQCFLFPVISRQKVVAVLYGDSEGGVDAGTLEMLVLLAGAALDSRSAAPPTPPAGLVTIGGPERLAPPDWGGLSREEQELHLGAQRFGRVRVAEMRLYKAEAVKFGRAQRSLYAELREEVDSARETFRSQFIVPCPSMVDYFHLELVRTLANNDAALLGTEYPGPLV